jgi:hypothetical protein
MTAVTILVRREKRIEISVEYPEPRCMTDRRGFG